MSADGTDAVAGVSLPVRIYTSSWAHRLIPAGLAMALVSSVGPAVRERRNPAERADAHRFMHELLAHTDRAAEADVLAERWLAEKSRLRELFWRPWLLRKSALLDAEHWDAAHAGGRGCVIVFGHIVATWAVPAILAHHGRDLHVVVSPHYFQELPPGYEGVAIVHRRREYGEKLLDRSRLIPSDGDPARLLELLGSGHSVALAFDVPGWAATPFLGRKVALGSGPATLAFKAKVPVLPVVPERTGSRIDLRCLAPIEPGTYRNLPALRAGIASTFEPLVVRAPEEVELAWNPSPLVNEVPPERLAAMAKAAAQAAAAEAAGDAPAPPPA